MKKVFLFFSIAILSIVLCSCNDTRVVDIDNVTWKNDDFNIIASSSQLQKQKNNQHLPDDDYYSSITVLGTLYSCEINIANGAFFLNLYDSSNSSKINFFGESTEFLWGHYNFSKVKNKEYNYSLSILLNNSGQYYEYCVENDKMFPNTIILYGYENK